MSKAWTRHKVKLCFLLGASRGWELASTLRLGQRTRRVHQHRTPSLQPTCLSLQHLPSSRQGVSLDHTSLSHPASFFGENHLEVPVAAALTNIDLQLQFSTSQPEALLLLAAGQADHLLLQLYSGRLQVSDIPLGPGTGFLLELRMMPSWS